MRRTYLLSRWLFLRLLGLVYLIAFASLAVQITGLVGEHGLLPAGPFPGFVAPYQPRLDWQMWFAGLDPMGNWEWLRSLAGHLRAGTPEVLALLGRDPFAGAPPHRIRLARYEYRFSTPAERARTGAWWVRELTGYLPAEP